MASEYMKAGRPASQVGKRQGRQAWVGFPAFVRTRGMGTELPAACTTMPMEPRAIHFTPLHGDLACNSRKCIIRVGVTMTCPTRTPPGTGFGRVWPLLYTVAIIIKMHSWRAGLVQGQMSSWPFGGAGGFGAESWASRAAAYIQHRFLEAEASGIGFKGWNGAGQGPVCLRERETGRVGPEGPAQGQTGKL